MSHNSDDIRQRVKVLRNSGYQPAEIASKLKILGVTVERVQDMLCSTGAKRSRRKKQEQVHYAKAHAPSGAAHDESMPRCSRHRSIPAVFTVRLSPTELNGAGLLVVAQCEECAAAIPRW